jgi:signal transduction histidine kinase
MLLIFSVALLIALIGSTMIVGGMARPLEALAATARRIAANDYTPPEPIHEAHELGQLSHALINMTQSIAEREGALTAAISSLEIARNEAVRANEAKSQFLANMSHELRTPLNAIVGFGDMMSGEVLGPLGKPRYVEYARDISGSGQHLLTLVSRMLDLAESEAGKLQIVHAPFSIAAVVERLMGRFQTFADKNGVTLGGPSNMAIWPTLSGDAAKLEQAIAGVLHNAIKFTPAGGHVDITGEWRDSRFAVIVADSGIGMDGESIATVVRPFQRLRSALDGQHQGAGLGLSFAKAIVEAHEGTLRIDSLMSVGTRVEMEFPAQAATVGTKPSAARSVA